jgi:excisionase family DNA binding protein
VASPEIRTKRRNSDQSLNRFGDSPTGGFGQTEGKEMITVDEVAAELGIAPFTVRKYARQNLIPALKVGRDWRFQSLEHVISTLSLTKGNKIQQAAGRAMGRSK